MRLELGWFYIYIGREGFHIELDKHPHVWFTIHLSNKAAFESLERELSE